MSHSSGRIGKRGLLLVATIGGAVAASGVFAANASALPALPGANVSSTSTDGASILLERARRGVVSVERDGHAISVGSVLSGDGRIVTSFSALGGAEQADVRYADGTTAHVRLGHHERAWDLALLIPTTGRWTEGLLASEADPATAAELDAFATGRGQTPVPAPATLKARVEARGKEGQFLSDALEFEVRGAPAAGSTIGAPIVDANGNVVAVLVHACLGSGNAGPPSGAHAADAPPSPCVEITIGAPVRALRHFLVTTPPNAVAPAPWLGIRGEPDNAGNVHGVRVIAVATGSPADKGGLKANLEKAQGDVIVAVDGHPVEAPEKLSELISKHGVGDKVKLLVFTGDHFREVVVELRAAP